MGSLLLLVGSVLVLGYAWLERAMLTLAEAGQLDAQEKDGTAPILTKKLYQDVLAARLGLFCGIALMAYGWLVVADPWYHLLRDGLSFSRVVAAGVALLLPAGLFALLLEWLGHIWGEARYEWLQGKAWVLHTLFPFRMIAIPLQALAISFIKQSDPAAPDTALMSLSGSPDAFWQMVQDEEGRDLAVVNRQIFDNATELQSIRVRECMTFRTDIVAVEEEDGIEGLREAFLSSGYSKIPVYKEDLDHVLGYCHSSSLFRKPKHIEDILSDILTVPESMTASQLLVELNQAQKSMAVVIDEYGGTSGVVTMEDVMEEIFGEIQDEMDVETETELQESEDTWLLSARLEVDYLNDRHGWDLPTGEYESLGGLVVQLNQDLPDQGEVIEAPPFRFEIVGMEETRVTLIRLTFLS